MPIDTRLKEVDGRNKAMIIQFPGALNDDSFDKTIPAKVPGNLQVGGLINH